MSIKDLQPVSENRSKSKYSASKVPHWVLSDRVHYLSLGLYYRVSVVMSLLNLQTSCLNIRQRDVVRRERQRAEKDLRGGIMTGFLINVDDL